MKTTSLLNFRRASVVFGVMLLSMRLCAFETVHEAAQEFKQLVTGTRDATTQQRAASIVQKAQKNFFINHSGIVTGMINHYYAVFGESPFVVEYHIPDYHAADTKIIEAEQRYNTMCHELKRLQEEMRGLEQQLVQEKRNNEKLYQELVAMSIASAQGVVNANTDSATLASLYEKLKEVFKQYHLEFQMGQRITDDECGEAKEDHEKLDDQRLPKQIEEELREMLEQWDAIMDLLRVLSEKAEKYDQMKVRYDIREVELKRVTEQRDLLERQLRDLHRKFENEQKRVDSEVRDARSQTEAVRNQLAAVKNELAVAKKQHQIGSNTNEAVEKQLQAERIAYEGALSDERMQRQKLRQQVNELQKRLETERTSYENRVRSLEQEVVMLIERLPSNQEAKRASIPLGKWEVKKETPAQQEEKRRI